MSTIQLAVVIPTFNEVANVEPLLARLRAALAGLRWEAIFVDDNSADGTAAHVRRIGQDDMTVRVVQRVGRRGLSSAVIEGMLATSAPVLAVIDADLQHDEAILPRLYDEVAVHGADIAVGTRYRDGGSTGDWAGARTWISRAATVMSQRILRIDLSDPMSGFFVVSRQALERALPNLSSIGFKILMDLVASMPQPPRVVEIPYTFRNRQAGESKLDAKVAQEFLVLLVDKLVGHIVPIRFVLFALVGATGLMVHLGVLWLAFRLFDWRFSLAQGAAVLAAMTFNFFLNNTITYRDMRLRGAALVRGLVTFYLVCLIGAVGNVGVADLIYAYDSRWWVAGIAGALVGVVWNYAASAVVTWRK